MIAGPHKLRQPGRHISGQPSGHISGQPHDHTSRQPLGQPSDHSSGHPSEQPSRQTSPVLQLSKKAYDTKGNCVLKTTRKLNMTNPGVAWQGAQLPMHDLLVSEPGGQQDRQIDRQTTGWAG